MQLSESSKNRQCNLYIHFRDATILQYIAIFITAIQYNTPDEEYQYINIFYLPSCKNPIITLQR